MEDAAPFRNKSLRNDRPAESRLPRKNTTNGPPLSGSRNVPRYIIIYANVCVCVRVHIIIVINVMLLRLIWIAAGTVANERNQ